MTLRQQCYWRTQQSEDERQGTDRANEGLADVDSCGDEIGDRGDVGWMLHPVWINCMYPSATTTLLLARRRQGRDRDLIRASTPSSRISSADAALPLGFGSAAGASIRATFGV